MEYLLYAIILGFIFMLATGTHLLLKSRDPVLARIEGSGTNHATHELSLQKEKENVRADRFLKPFQDKLRREQETKNFKSEKTNILRAAGYYNPRAGAILYSIRVTLAVILTVGLSTIFIISGTALKPVIATLCVVLIGAIGYYFPLLIVSSKAKERRIKFSDGLPDALDMILICLESGLSFPASLKYIAKEFRKSHPIISEHFEIVNLEFQAGRKRSEALKNLGARVDLPELNSLVNMINQSDTLGTSLTRSMRAATKDMRRNRMLKAEEKANVLPVKMAIPLTTCIFPTLFCIIIVPVIISIATVL